MKAMIFAAGLGTRLRPLTDTVPKALIPVGGKPLLEHVILKLRDAGFDHLVVNIHHLGQQIIDFLAAKGNFGLRIDISDERGRLLDTGGGIRHAAPLLGSTEPFLVHNVDIFSDADLRALYAAHCRTPRLATLLVSHRRTSRHLLFDADGRLCGWHNVETGEVKSPYPALEPDRCTAYAFSGIHVLSADVFRLMERFPEKFSIIDFYLSVCAGSRLLAYPVPDLKLLDVGKRETLAAAEDWLKSGI